VSLLTHTGLASIERNRRLEALADQVRRRPDLADCLRAGDCPEKAPEFRQSLEGFIERFGDLSCSVTGGTQCEGATRPLAKILLEMAARPQAPAGAEKRADVGNSPALSGSFPESRRGKPWNFSTWPGRATGCATTTTFSWAESSPSWRRPLPRAGGGWIRAGGGRGARGAESGAGKPRLRQPDAPGRPPALSKGGRVRPVSSPASRPGRGWPRQSPGVQRHADLEDFAHGEVLVCDAVDPNMTFVVPLAAAVVEHRGGMLIHGAIIAREYGLPCVTGIPEVTSLVRTGDLLTVDGYLGIVTVGSGEL